MSSSQSLSLLGSFPGSLFNVLGPWFAVFLSCSFRRVLCDGRDNVGGRFLQGSCRVLVRFLSGCLLEHIPGLLFVDSLPGCFT